MVKVEKGEPIDVPRYEANDLFKRLYLSSPVELRLLSMDWFHPTVRELLGIIVAQHSGRMSFFEFIGFLQHQMGDIEPKQFKEDAGEVAAFKKTISGTWSELGLKPDRYGPSYKPYSPQSEYVKKSSKEDIERERAHY